MEEVPTRVLVEEGHWIVHLQEERGRTVTATIAAIAEFAPPKPYMITVLHSGVCAPYCHTIAPVVLCCAPFVCAPNTVQLLL